jgi:hypothetical protein
MVMNMLIRKSRSFLTLLLLISGFLAFSQEEGFAEFETRKGSFNVGAEGGVQFTNIRSSNSVFQSTGKMGYTIGAFGDYYFTNNLRLRVALNYDNRAFQINSSLPLLDTAGKVGASYYLYQVDYSLNYLTIPVSIIFNRGSEKFKLLLQLNLYYSIFLGANMEGGEDFYIAPDEAGNLPDDSDLLPGHNFYAYSGPTEGLAYAFNQQLERFNSFDLGVNLMIGAIYQITPTVGLSLSVGFTYGFADAYENPELDSQWSQITKINLGFAYTLWK